MNTTIDNEQDKRRYPRLASGVNVQFHSTEVSDATREYLNGVAENFSFGGMFLVTPKSFRKGSVLLMDFSFDNEAPVSVSAIVRWTRRFRKPTGIGVEFVEFTGIGNRNFESLMKRIFAT